MLVNSQDHSYEVVQALPGKGIVLHYLALDEEGRSLHLVSMGRGEGLKPFLPFLSELEENAAFTDLMEYFWEEGILWLVFVLKKGRELNDCLGEECPGAERFDLARRIMEQIILNMMPLWLQQEVLTGERIIVGEDGEVGFFYSLSGWRGYGAVDGNLVSGCLGSLLRRMFQAEEESGLYPEWNEWLEHLSSGKWDGILDIYQSYVKLAPVFAVERGKQEEKPGFRERLKKCLPRVLALVKVAAGLVVLTAAIAGAAALWKEKAVPVIEAAKEWKAVYVDGEAREPEADGGEGAGEEGGDDAGEDSGKESGEEEGGDDAGSEAASEAGQERGELFREDGSLCYRGGLKDGLYDDTGTLYYPDGTIAYQGGFAFGKKEGEGCQYTDAGVIYYEGGFKKDLFEGAGKLYDADTGKLVYEGDFSGGRFDGEGILYDGDSGLPVYIGGFRLGRFDGKGLEFDSSGSLVYEGEYLLGRFHGEGLVYDAVTGEVAAEGVFRNGIYVGAGDGEGEAGAGEEMGGTGEGEAGGGEGQERTGESGAGTGEGQAGAKKGPGGTGEDRQGTVEGQEAAGDDPADKGGTQADASAGPAAGPGGDGPGTTHAAKQETEAIREIGPGIQ